MLGIFFVNVIFITLHKKSLFAKTFLNSMHSFKSAILAIFQFWQNGTLKPMYGIQNFFWLKDLF
jgi:hypothetical protein